MKIKYNMPSGYIRVLASTDVALLESAFDFEAGVEYEVDDALGNLILEKFGDEFVRVDDQSISDDQVDAESSEKVPTRRSTRRSSDSAAGDPSDAGTDLDAGS